MHEDDGKLPAVVQGDGLDAFGFGSIAKYLAGPIVHGVGKMFKPLVHRLDNAAQIANWNSWDEALKTKGYSAKSVELTLGERAEVRLLAEAIDKQANREAVASEAVMCAKTLVSDPSVGRLPAPDIEWVERFWRLAENVNQVEMQRVWGTVLARCASGSASFSARALEFLSTLSGEEARKLERIAKYVVTYKVDDDLIDSAIMSHLTYFSDRLSGEENARIDEFNNRLRKHVGDIDTPLFGSLGIYIESGWAHEISQNPKAGTIYFSIAGLELEAVLPAGRLDKTGKYHIGGSTGLSPLGREIVAMINPEPDMAYLDLLREGFSLKGLELRHVPLPG